MDILSGQPLFYLGILIIGIAVLVGIVSLFLIKIKSMRLNQKFEAEYGKPPRK